MTENQALIIVEKVRAKVRKTGGWEGPWALKMGLTRSQVGQWACRKRIPPGWVLALKQAIRRL